MLYIFRHPIKREPRWTRLTGEDIQDIIFCPEPRGPRALPVRELVLWYGMFAPCGRFLGTTGFARGAP